MKAERSFQPILKEASKKHLEAAIGNANLLNELRILSKEFFIGTFSTTEQGIALCFFHGQKFLLRLEAMNS